MMVVLYVREHERGRAAQHPSKTTFLFLCVRFSAQRPSDERAYYVFLALHISLKLAGNLYLHFGNLNVQSKCFVIQTMLCVCTVLSIYLCNFFLLSWSMDFHLIRSTSVCIANC